MRVWDFGLMSSMAMGFSPERTMRTDAREENRWCASQRRSRDKVGEAEDVRDRSLQLWVERAGRRDAKQNRRSLFQVRKSCLSFDLFLQLVRTGCKRFVGIYNDGFRSMLH